MKRRALAIALLAFLGMVDALYLSFKRNAGPIPCHVTQGCNDVLTSKYSAVAGVPISWFGLAFYLTVFSIAVFAYFDSPGLLNWIYWPTGVALLISGLLTGIQAFTLHAYCEYCLVSAALVTTIFLLAPHPNSHTPPG